MYTVRWDHQTSLIPRASFLPTTWLRSPAMAGASASAAISGGPRRTSKRPETIRTVVVEPAAAASSALCHAHPMETTPSPVAAAPC
jgi:hypothetical protein